MVDAIVFALWVSVVGTFILVSVATIGDRHSASQAIAWAFWMLWTLVVGLIHGGLRLYQYLVG